MRQLYIEPLPHELWHVCEGCHGTGSVFQEEDCHRSAGIIPCPNRHCSGGKITSHTVDRTPEPLRSELDRKDAEAAAERRRKFQEWRKALDLSLGISKRRDQT